MIHVSKFSVLTYFAYSFCIKHSKRILTSKRYRKSTRLKRLLILVSTRSSSRRWKAGRSKSNQNSPKQILLLVAFRSRHLTKFQLQQSRNQHHPVLVDLRWVDNNQRNQILEQLVDLLEASRWHNKSSLFRLSKLQPLVDLKWTNKLQMLLLLAQYLPGIHQEINQNNLHLATQGLKILALEEVSRWALSRLI